MSVKRRYKRPLIFLHFAAGEFDADTISADIDCASTTVRNAAEIWRSLTENEKKWEIKKAREYVDKMQVAGPEARHKESKKTPGRYSAHHTTPCQVTGYS